MQTQAFSQSMNWGAVIGRRFEQDLEALELARLDDESPMAPARAPAYEDVTEALLPQPSPEVLGWEGEGGAIR